MRRANVLIKSIVSMARGYASEGIVVLGTRAPLDTPKKRLCKQDKYLLYFYYQTRKNKHNFFEKKSYEAVEQRSRCQNEGIGVGVLSHRFVIYAGHRHFRGNSRRDGTACLTQ